MVLSIESKVRKLCINSTQSRLCGLIVRVRVVPRRTVVGDIDRRFDNLSGSHHQTLMTTSAQVVETSVNGHQQQSFSGLLSPGRSNHTNDWDSWVQTIYRSTQSVTLGVKGLTLRYAPDQFEFIGVNKGRIVGWAFNRSFPLAKRYFPWFPPPPPPPLPAPCQYYLLSYHNHHHFRRRLHLDSNKI